MWPFACILQGWSQHLSRRPTRSARILKACATTREPVCIGRLGASLRRQIMATCREVMTREPASSQPTDSLVRVAQVMKSHDVGAVPVVDGASRKLVGMIPARDLTIKELGNG